MHVYQMRSSVPSVVSASQERISVCMTALKEVSKVWLVAKMVHTLFESILGNKMLEERLQKAAGRRAQKTNRAAANANNATNATTAPPQPAPTATKRKYDDIDLGFASGPPAPQVSYERSRPQTPSVTPSRDLGQANASNAERLTSPPQRRSSEQFLPTGVSRGVSRSQSRVGTRANSPFGYSMPTTPPDLFLVTRNSPPISQSLWENFQPDQLFPDGAGIDGFPLFQHSNNAMVDPQLQQMSGQQTLSVPGMDMNGANQGMWATQAMMGETPGDHSDAWSTSSRGQAPIVPTALNVEDWFQFFGINGENVGALTAGMAE